MEQELWFSREEYRARLARVWAELRERRLDLLLAFQPETVTYLTGFFTMAYGQFQFAIVPVDRDPVVVCRDAEEYELDRTCAFSDRVLWADGEDTVEVAAAAVRRAGGAAARIGIETSTWALPARHFEAIRAGLPRAEFVDVEHLVARHRLIKSPAEVAYQRRAARAAEAAMTAAVTAAKPGASERYVAAAIASAVVLAGSDRALQGPLSSGPRAGQVHSHYSDRVLEEGDTLHYEPVPCVRFHHARFMRPIKVGRATREEQELARALLAVQDRALAEVGPGVPAAIPDRVYREGIQAAAGVSRYTNRTFYSIGLHFPPNAGEFLLATPGCDWRFEVGMTFHTYLCVRGFGFSETILITPGGFERLTLYPRELIVS